MCTRITQLRQHHVNVCMKPHPLMQHVGGKHCKCMGLPIIVTRSDKLKEPLRPIPEFSFKMLNISQNHSSHEFNSSIYCTHKEFWVPPISGVSGAHKSSSIVFKNYRFMSHFGSSQLGTEGLLQLLINTGSWSSIFILPKNQVGSLGLLRPWNGESLEKNTFSADLSYNYGDGHTFNSKVGIKIVSGLTSSFDPFCVPMQKKKMS